MELTNIEHNIILGTLLGDGCLQKRSKKARLRITHSIKQREYVDWKYSKLKRLCERTKPPSASRRAKPCYKVPPTPLRVRGAFRPEGAKRSPATRSLGQRPREPMETAERATFEFEQHPPLRLSAFWMPRAERSHKFGTCYYFSTQSEKILLKYYELFYYQQRKTITFQLLDFIKDPLSLAIWWLDDGFAEGNGSPCCARSAAQIDCSSGRLATQGYTLEEQKILQQLLLKNFQIHSNIVRHSKKQYSLYIPKKNKNFVYLINLITPYISQIPSMKYKLGKNP